MTNTIDERSTLILEEIAFQATAITDGTATTDGTEIADPVTQVEAKTEAKTEAKSVDSQSDKFWFGLLLSLSIATWVCFLAVTTDWHQSWGLLYITLHSTMIVTILSIIKPATGSFVRRCPGVVALYVMTAISGIVLSLPYGFSMLF